MTTPPRPDQEIDPPAQSIAPGGAAGVFRGRLVVVFGSSGSGVFVYNPVPGPGTLIASVAGDSGTDPYGNAFTQGFLSTSATGNNQTQINSGAILVQKTAGLLAPPRITIADLTQASLGATYINPGSAQFPFIATTAPGTFDTTETWHSLGSPSATGFSSDYGRYRMTPEGEVEFDIQLSSAGGGTGGTYTYANTLPTAYRPVNIRVYPLCRTDTAPGGQFFPCLQVHASGAVQIQVPGIAAGNQVGGQAFMPLD